MPPKRRRTAKTAVPPPAPVAEKLPRDHLPAPTDSRLLEGKSLMDIFFNKELRTVVLNGLLEYLYQLDDYLVDEANAHLATCTACERLEHMIAVDHTHRSILNRPLVIAVDTVLRVMQSNSVYQEIFLILMCMHHSEHLAHLLTGTEKVFWVEFFGSMTQFRPAFYERVGSLFIAGPYPVLSPQDFVIAEIDRLFRFQSRLYSASKTNVAH